jgi:hypothetical protein
MRRRAISCPAPPKYANAAMDDDDEEEEDGEGIVIPQSSLGSHSDRPMSSKRWLEERQQSSLENIEWSATDASERKNSIEENAVEEAPTSNNNADKVKEYNVKSGQKMLPMQKIRPTSE